MDKLREGIENLVKTNRPSHAIWVKTPQDEWKLYGGEETGDLRNVDTEAFKQKGYKELRLVPNGENWDYEEQTKSKDLLDRYYNSEMSLDELHDQLIKVHGNIKPAFEWLLKNARR